MSFIIADDSMQNPGHTQIIYKPVQTGQNMTWMTQPGFNPDLEVMKNAS